MPRAIGIGFVFLSFLCIGYGQDLVTPYLVNTTIGLVRGSPATDGDYVNYLGIPYGKIDDNNPFGIATPHPPFDEIFEANDDSAICPQREEFNFTIVGTLDCLHLNVHVPSSAGPNNLLPVFVWIYGGGFSIGFYGRFLYGPKFLTRHDIIFISLNYRLGPYGFMSLDTPEIPGNQGLKDQVMALRWIRNNIAAFGGDPDKITIAGNSAGSVSVDFHILRENDGPPLFHQAILQSGTAYLSLPETGNRYIPLMMAQYLGYDTTNIDEALAFLAQQDPLDVIATSSELDLTFNVVMEKEFEDVEPFITENWLTISEIPNTKGMPIIIGFNDDEALSVINLMSPDPTIITIFMALLFDATHPDFGSVVENVQNFYFGAGESGNPEQQLIDFLGDLLFIYPTHRRVERFLEHEVGNLYLYEFSHVGERNFVRDKDNITRGGACHADELGYLFDISYMAEPSTEDQKVIDIMTALWTNFIKYGDPTPQTSVLLPHKWEVIASGSPYHYMNIDKEIKVGTRPLQERMTFWQLLYDGFGHLERTVASSEIRMEIQQLANLKY